MKIYLKVALYSIVTLVAFNTSIAFASSNALYITTQSKTVSNGENINIDVKVQSTDQSINAVSGTIVFPSDMLKTVSVTRDNSILNIWTHDPNVERNQISFEGVILNPGYLGSSGQILRITFKAQKTGVATISFKDGAILANNGLGTNILTDLKSVNFNIIGVGALDLIDTTVAQSNTPSTRLPALPVITEYSGAVNSKDSAYLKGKGEPNAITEIAFEDISHKSFGEQFMDFIQSKKKRLVNTLVKNNDKGLFEYVSPTNLVAGVYDATPFLVDNETSTSKPGLGVQLLVNDSKIIKYLIVFINILVLLIPIVGLIMIIYFIPWYSSRRMRILKRKMGLEEEKILLTEHQLERQDETLSKVPLTHESTEKIE